MLKLFHEAPISIFNEVQKITDGDYALCHLLETNKEYVELFLRASEQGREIILDNSSYELENPVDIEILIKWIKKLDPEWVVAPDFMDDCLKTLHSTLTFIHTLEEKGLKRQKVVGVVQGKSFEDWCSCYRMLRRVLRKTDMIAFNFHPCWFTGSDPILAMQRPLAINRMLHLGVIDLERQHHLLGCQLPQEVGMYINMPFIHSMDTSAPIMHAISGDPQYYYHLPTVKPHLKIVDCLGNNISRVIADVARQNIEEMRRWANGGK